MVGRNIWKNMLGQKNVLKKSQIRWVKVFLEKTSNTLALLSIMEKNVYIESVF